METSWVCSALLIKGVHKEITSAFTSAVSPSGDTALGTEDKAHGHVLPTGSEGQEDAPHVHELVVIAVPTVLPAFPPAGTVHPKRKCVSILKASEAVTLHRVPTVVMSEHLAQTTTQRGGFLLSVLHWGHPTSAGSRPTPGSTDLCRQPLKLPESSSYEGISLAEQNCTCNQSEHRCRC